MYAHPHPGIPSGIIERTDRETLRQDGLRIEGQIHQCDTALNRLATAMNVVRTLRCTVGDRDAELSLVDAVNGLEDVVSAVQAARKALDGSISPAMDAVL